MSRVSRKEAVFYDHFRASSKMIVEAAELFVRIVGEWPSSKPLIPLMKEFESRHDELTGQAMDELNRSFITPFDRDDVFQLITLLDDIVDGMEGVSARFAIYDVNVMIAPAKDMADLTLASARELQTLFEHFDRFKKDPVVTQQMRRVNELEDQGDVVYREALGAVFAAHDDPIHTLKWKSLLDKMEDALDDCKHVSNVAHSVVMKNA